MVRLMTNMSYIYAALILHENGKEITPDGIISILKAAGIPEIDEGFAKAVASALSKVNIEEIKSKALFAPVAAPAAARRRGDISRLSSIIRID